MFSHAVLKTWHPMIGIDYHIPWPPGSPSPAPSPVPYQTRMVLYGTGIKATLCPTHLNSGFGTTIAKGSDIGPMIPHMGPPSITLMLEIVFSASKCHFGPANVQADGNVVACALLLMVNPNLNCGTPIPTPTGMVMALNTYGVSMTMADIQMGMAGMLVDTVVQAALNKVGNAVSGVLADKFKVMFPYIASRLFPQYASKTAAKAVLKAAGQTAQRDINVAARELIANRAALYAKAGAASDTTAAALTNFFMGGPMGADAGDFGLPTWYSASPAQGMTDAATNYLGTPSVEEHSGDSPAGPSGGEDAGGESDGGTASTDSGDTSGGTDAGVPSGDQPDAGVGPSDADTGTPSARPPDQ